MHSGFTNLEWYSKAAMARVVLNDVGCNPSRQFMAIHDKVRFRMQYPLPASGNTRLDWQDWFGRAFITTIVKTHDEVKNLAGDWEQLRNTRRVKPIPTHEDKSWKTETQQTIYKLIAAKEAISPWQRMRNKQIRWKLGAPERSLPAPGTAIQSTPRWRSERACWLLRTLKDLVPPRVQAAVFSTCWNRWITHKRFQVTRNQGCLLGCGRGADSIEHYCGCNKVQEVFRRKLNLDATTFANLHSFTMTNPHIKTSEQLTSLALGIYGVYTATNRLRAQGGIQERDAVDALTQAIRDGAKGHGKALKALQQRWMPGRSETPLPTQPAQQFDRITLTLRKLANENVRLLKRTRREAGFASGEDER
jgi:hypothetical protein